ncbi:hypothetical protein Daus18300_000597 [Diaporthe australafricana]|uniref:Uncharacterized protein n=1 Tax=Diaporthe australafricana TaxID=127596 RepID=A0ABR3Y4L1_9PEZI
MTEKLTETLPTDRLFWPKWQIKFDDDTVYPASFSGVHLGTVAENNASEDSKRHFFPPLDMLFIDNYVFEHYERPDVEISLEADGALPETLDAVQKVAIDASSLSHSEDKDTIWCKKLRFILRNFPNIRAIIVLAAIVLDMASPASMPQPIYFMDIGNASVQDRVRHGVLTGDDDVAALPYNPETLRPSDFAMQEWDSLPVEWPAFGRRRGDGTAPELYMGAMVLFGREWVSLEGVGAPGRLCRLGDRGVDTMGAIVRSELNKAGRAARAAQADARVAEKRNAKKKGSMFSLRHKDSGSSLSRKTSSYSVRSQPSKAILKSQRTF